ASAEPLRLRADALATTQAPAGLLTLEADGAASATTAAEAVGWTASDTADVLVIALRARTADGRASTPVGRVVATPRAIPPRDGAAGRVRLPHRFDVEAFAGVPVVSGLATARTWDWAAGARIARRLGDYGSVGIAMFEQRDDGRLSAEELGLDAGAALSTRDDA